MTTNGSVAAEVRTISTIPPGSGPQLATHGGDYRPMLPLSPLLGVPDAALLELAAAMTESSDSPKLDNHGIPAGYTYLGQLIAHDLTHDPSPTGRAGGSHPRNHRTPALDLDWLYGSGPFFDPHLYERGGAGKLRVGSTTPSRNHRDQPVPSSNNDLPRDANGFAQIADMRNDGLLILSQLHLAFIKAHNRLMSTGLNFPEAQNTLIWHYQQTVLHDFLKRLIDEAVFTRVVEAGPRHFEVLPDPYLPTEFACAGFRLHSMVRGTYNYNSIFPESRLEQLLGFTGFSHGGALVPIPSSWVIDWRRFFAISGDVVPNPSRCLDAQLTQMLNRGDPTIPGFDRGLAERTLLRGAKMGLPSGQDVATFFGATPLDPEQIKESPDGKVAERLGLLEKTPLWYYLMKEAELSPAKGQRLGPAGSEIVAEVLVGLVRATSQSGFEITEERARLIEPGMKGLLEFVGELNPVGD